MFFVAAPSQYDAARIFSIPAGICVFIGLTGFVLNGYALRPAEAAKAQAGRMLSVAQGLADTVQVLTATPQRLAPLERSAARARLARLRTTVNVLLTADVLVDSALQRALRDASIIDARADERIRQDVALAQRALVRRGLNMLATAQHLTDRVTQIFLALLALALLLSLAGLRWAAGTVAHTRNAQRVRWSAMHGTGHPAALNSALNNAMNSSMNSAMNSAVGVPGVEAGDSLAATVLNTSNESICVADRDGVIRKVNAAYLRLTGYRTDEVVGQDLDFNLAPRPGDTAVASCAATLSAKGAWQGELWRRHKFGEAYVEQTNRALLRDEHGELVGVVSIARDLSANRDAQRLLLWQANHDQLTKLPNRALFLDRLGTMTTRQSERGALMILDVDRFKDINGKYGYAAGDQLLTQIAHRLALTVTDGDTVARLEGDRFAVLVASTLREGDAERIVRTLLENVRAPITVADQLLSVTASVGVTVFPDDGQDVNVLVRQAEQALADHKQLERNGYRFHDATRNADAVRRATLETALASAIDQNQLYVVYQPIVDVQQQKTYAVEALLRWQHPSLGAIAPTEFIPIAEDSGLITPIGLWVCDTIASQMDQWARTGLRDMRVSVNISARQLRTPEQRDAIAQRLMGRHAHKLTVEITESVLLAQNADVAGFLERVRTAGVQVALDDFGTGYSSLSYLLRFPIDVLKIDKSFVDHMDRDNRALQLVATIVSMGRILGMRVIAEGVENESQVQKLGICGGELIQGYFFARPLAAEDVLPFVMGTAGLSRMRLTA